MKKKESAIERIRQLADWLIAHDVVRSVAQFEVICGLSSRYIYNLTSKGNGNPGVDTIAAIYDVFPAVNVKWLVVGEGKMFTARDEQEMLERMKLDIVAREVLSATKEKDDIKVALKKALRDHKDDLTADEKVAILERLL